MAAGLNATLSLAQMNQDYGADIATIRNALSRLKARYDTHWLATGPADYVAAGGTITDRDTLGSAITECVNLYGVWKGTVTIASGGTVTTGASGHNFDTFMAKVSGDSVV